MIFREAVLKDIPQLKEVRISVKENILNTPGLVTDLDYEYYLTSYGKGWVYETDSRILGFSIVGLKQKNIWALFVRPEYEGQGIGRKLHDLMMDWYFSKTNEKVWLSTSIDTRAEIFYTKSGWTNVGMLNGEIKFEMSFEDWEKLKARRN